MAKQPVKEVRNWVWMDVAIEICRIVGEDYLIVYMDFTRHGPHGKLFEGGWN